MHSNEAKLVHPRRLCFSFLGRDKCSGLFCPPRHIFLLLLAGLNDSLKLIFTCEWQGSVSLLEASGGGVSMCL